MIKDKLNTERINNINLKTEKIKNISFILPNFNIKNKKYKFIKIDKEYNENIKIQDLLSKNKSNINIIKNKIKDNYKILSNRNFSNQNIKKDWIYNDSLLIKNKYIVKKVNNINYYNQFNTSKIYNNIKKDFLNNLISKKTNKKSLKLKKEKLKKLNRKLIINEIKYDFHETNRKIELNNNSRFSNINYNNNNFFFERIMCRKNTSKQIDKYTLMYMNTEFYNNYHPGAFAHCCFIKDKYNIYILKNECIWIMDIDLLKWEKYSFKNSKLLKLYSSTIVKYLSNFYLFFGRNEIDKMLNNKIIKINVLSQEIIVIKDLTKKEPQNRIYQFSIKLDNYVYFMGGQNNSLIFFGDIWKFDLKNQRWTQMKKYDPFNLFESLSATNGFQLKEENINDYTNNNLSKNLNFIDSKIYLILFGGFNNIKNSNNNLIRVEIEKIKISFKLIPTKGKKPLSRGFHCFELIDNLNIAIWYGGRNENDTIFSLNYSLNDLWIICLKSWIWIEVSNNYIQLPESYGMISCFNKKKFIIFGGCNDQNFNDMMVHQFYFKEKTYKFDLN